jgi:hypothetical protein
VGTTGNGSTAAATVMTGGTWDIAAFRDMLAQRWLLAEAVFRGCARDAPALIGELAPLLSVSKGVLVCFFRGRWLNASRWREAKLFSIESQLSQQIVDHRGLSAIA